MFLVMHKGILLIAFFHVYVKVLRWFNCIFKCVKLTSMLNIEIYTNLLINLFYLTRFFFVSCKTWPASQISEHLVLGLVLNWRSDTVTQSVQIVFLLLLLYYWFTLYILSNTGCLEIEDLHLGLNIGYMLHSNSGLCSGLI